MRKLAIFYRITFDGASPLVQIDEKRRSLRAAVRLLRRHPSGCLSIYRYARHRGTLNIRARWVWSGLDVRRQRWNKRTGSWV